MRPCRLIHVFWVAIMVALMLSWPAGAAAVATTSAPAVDSAELVEHPDRWDGQRVSFTGEAVGSAMDRGREAWLHVNDDAYGLETGAKALTRAGYNSGHAVLVPTALAQKVTRFGSYKERGDIVRVEGVFRSASPEHGGDMIIEADTLEIVRAGQSLERRVPAWKLLAVAALVLTTGMSLVFARTTQHRPD